MKIALVYKNLKAGNPDISHVGLGVTAENIRASLAARGVQAVVWAVREGYHLQKKLRHDPDITHVNLFAPWMDTNFMEYGLARRFPSVEFAMTCHSNVGFLQADRWAVKIIREGLDLQRRVPNFHIAGNSAKFVKWVEEAYRATCLHLPNLYYLKYPGYPQRDTYTRGTLRIGLFGATRVQKNMMTAAAAALVIARQMRARHTELWVSSGRVEGGQGVMAAVTEMVKDLAHVSLRETGWLDWPDFRNFTGQMHLMLQPSYTESFNNVTADGIAMGTPSVVSDAIDWTPRHWQALADDAVDVARVGRYLLTDTHAAREGYIALQNYNRTATRAWERFLHPCNLNR